MSIIITRQDIIAACGNPIDRLKLRTYMHDKREEHGSVILHLGEETLGISLAAIGGVEWCDEVWVIRQIGPATCIKNRYREAPYDEMFF
jgi:hypothetical protein